MSQTNRISITIPPEVIAQCIDNANKIRTALAPYLQSLSEEERKTIAKLGNKTVSFVDKVANYCVTQPDFVPAYLSVAELNTDLSAMNDLTPLHDILLGLTNNIDDTQMLAGSEAYLASLLYYNSVHNAAKQGISTARTIYEDLSERFPGTRKKAAPMP